MQDYNMVYIFGDELQSQEIVNRLNEGICYKKADLSIDTVKCLKRKFNKTDFFVVADKGQLDILITTIGVKAKIIEYFLFKDLVFDNLLPNNIYHDIDTLIFGMSHSQCGLDLDSYHNILKLSKPSMDLFLQLRLLNRLSKQYVMNKISKIFIELPYYIFNYDLSRFLPFVFSKMNYFVEVGDFHNLTELNNLSNYIDQYDMFKKLFCSSIVKKKSQSCIIVRCFNYVRHKVNVTLEVIHNHDSVWNKSFNETIAENNSVFFDFISQINALYPNAKLTIVVMPFNPLFRYFHREAIKNVRKQFYDIVNETGITIIDDFSRFNNPILFDDHCHLSKLGAKKYTDYFLLNNY